MMGTQDFRSNNLSIIMEEYLNLISELIPANVYGIHLMKKGTTLELSYKMRAPAGFYELQDNVRDQDPLFNYIFTRYRSVTNRSIFEDTEWSNHISYKSVLAPYKLFHVMLVPLLDSSRELIAIAGLARPYEHPFRHEEQSLLPKLSGFISKALDVVSDFSVTTSDILIRNKMVNVSFYHLSSREAEILELVAYGLTDKEIAKRLYISTYTVKQHLKEVYSKMDATSRVMAICKLYGIHFNELKSPDVKKEKKRATKILEYISEREKE